MDLLPYLEGNALSANVRSKLLARTEPGWAWHVITADPELSELSIDLYKCPSTSIWQSVSPRRDYSGVTGGARTSSRAPLDIRQPIARNNRGDVFSNGLFNIGISRKLRQVIDGTSNTLAVGESISPSRWGGPVGWPGYGKGERSRECVGYGPGNEDCGGPGCWWHGGSCAKPDNNNGLDSPGWYGNHSSGRLLASVDKLLNSQYIDSQLAEDESNNLCFSSDHPGGVHFSFIDGHVQFISDSIDHETTLQYLATYAGQEVVDNF